jgi:hypothetical protein
MYGPRLSPKLPNFIRNLFNLGIFRFIVMVLVIYLGSKDLRLALSISIIFLILMSLVNTQNIKEDFSRQVKDYMASYNLFEESSYSPNHGVGVEEHFTENMSTGFNLKCTVDIDETPKPKKVKPSSSIPTVSPTLARKQATKAALAKQAAKATPVKLSPTLARKQAAKTAKAPVASKKVQPKKKLSERFEDDEDIESEDVEQFEDDEDIEQFEDDEDVEQFEDDEDIE